MTEAAELIEQIKQSNDTFSRHQCRHILEGQRCGSPAMRGEKFCYYHHETRKPVADTHRRRSRRNCFHLVLPRSRAAIQEAVGEVMTRIAYNEIDPRRAGLLLYALQIATTNIKDHEANQQQSKTKNPTSEPAAPQQDSFDTDLFAEPLSPEAARALYEAVAPSPHAGSPGHRKSQPAPAQTVPPAQATLQPDTSSESHADSQVDSNPATANSTPAILPTISACDNFPHPVNNLSRSNAIPYVSNMSPICHLIA